MTAWPGTLPQSLQMTLTVKRQSGKLRSQMETGPAKQRPRFTATPLQYEGELLMTGAELAIFRAFYDDDIGQGSGSFTWVDPIDDTPATLRFMDEYETTLVVPHDNPDNRIWRVTMPLEKMP